MKTMGKQCRKIICDKENHIILYLGDKNGNSKKHDFTEEVNKRNKHACFYTIVQQLIKRIHAKNIIGFYSHKSKDNLTFVLSDIANKKEYERYTNDKNQLILPLEIVKTECEYLQNIISKQEKVYLFKNKYENYFVDFKGNPSSKQRITRLITTDNIEEATRLSYLESLAMHSLFNIFMSDFHAESLLKVFENTASLITA